MASRPPGPCCVVGVKHEGTATGKMEKIGNIEAYVAMPEDGSTTHGVLLLPDIIGHAFINAQLVADQFAANGYFTVMPDLFEGDALPLNRLIAGADIQGWLRGPPGHLPERVDPIIEACLKEMRARGCKRIGSAGYCFGAKYVIRFLRPGQIDAGFIAHPSFVQNTELESIAGPLSVAAAENDFLFDLEKRVESEKILNKLGEHFEIHLFSNTEHGFATRGDVSVDRVKFAKEQAFFQAVHWFDKYIKEGESPVTKM